jgi:DNA repair exonuclease SbcCD ATPase subunit
VFQKLTLKNFQVHDKLEVDLSPTVTTIVGPSDAGKTAVLRALRLLCLNQPSRAKPFVKEGEPELTVELVVDGKKVVRKVGRHNLYVLDGKVFRAFGSGKVPQEITDLLNVSEVNFQRQMDLPFWFSETPGQVSKNLNEIVNLSVIDRALKKAGDGVRHARLALHVSQDRVAKAKDDYRRLRWAPAFVKDVKVLEQSVKDWKNIRRERERLGGLLTEIRKVDKAATAEIPDLTPLIELRKKGDRIAEQRRNLEFLLVQLKTSEQTICDLDDQIKQASENLKNASRRLRRCPTCGQVIKSPSSSAISICRKKHQSPGPRKERTGLKPLQGI